MEHVVRGSALLMVASLFSLPIASAQQGVPTPESVLGSRVGADFFLATYDESINYFQRLDAASDRLEMREVGRTS